MRAVWQRVSEASVTVDEEAIACIGPGALVLVGVQWDDTDADVPMLADRLLALRCFSDADGRMNLDIDTVGGELLLVSQFTLAADTRRGRRPGFSNAAPPDEARRLFDGLFELVVARHPATATGRFGADMRVALVNDGPVTFVLETRPG